MICSEFAELLDRYELLTDAERCELEKHASECEKCQSELEFFKSITSISTSIPLPKAPDTLIDEVNARLDAKPIIRFRPNVRILSTIAACLVLGISVGVNNGFIKKNIDGGNFAISVDKYGHYRFKLYNLSNRLICMSEDYSSKAKCESGIESVKRFAQTASVIQEEM